MKKKFQSLVLIGAVFSLGVIPISTSSADSDTKAKIISTKSVSGTRTIVKVSGAQSESGVLWTAKIPTKMKLAKDYSSYAGMVNFKFKNVVDGADGEERDDVRITVALWSVGGKKIEDRTLYDWSPVSATTDMEYRIFGSSGAKPGKYVWLITTSSSKYEGEGQIKVPVTIS